MNDQSTTRADGGVLRDDDGRDGDQRDAPDVDLPEDSILTREEYLEMYDVASGEPAFSILTALSEVERLSTGELADLLDREGNDLHYHLRKLKRTGLVRNRRDPNTGTEQPYSYYTLTDLGHTVLTYGLKTGIEKLAAEEAAISEQYGGED
ncbi:helix-turn-helix domain-containing protein [Halobacterium noricense]|uniref:helix-turn-helix domain-containing protein n=1 Tax=Halobacterium noricense TaxID=223182 RepID=UPI001E5DEF99|nr:helix-turn-helix domain-containing protein [Halobacterium noricense]UHH26331.1 helix-turn-helix domain-containing protein [Halobacterium noricense]